MFQLSSAPKSQIKAAEVGIPSSWLRKQHNCFWLDQTGDTILYECDQ